MSALTNFMSEGRRPFLAILLVALVLYLINFNSFQVGNNQDDAAYIVLAQSIATGRGYARINFPSPQPEVAWPIGYPLLLSPLVAIGGLFNFASLKLFSVLLTVLSILIVKKYLEFRTASPYVLIIVALYAFNLHIVRHATMVMTEPAYLVLSLLGLYLFDRFEKDKFAKWYQIPLLALILVATSLTRLIGGSLAIACVLILLLQRNFKSAIVLGFLYTLGMTPQLMLGKEAGGVLFPPEVAGQVNVWANLGKILPNFQAYTLEHIPQYGFGLFGPATTALASRFGILWVVLLIKWGLLSLILLGLLRLIRRKLTAGEIYFLIYFAIISVKTFDGVNDTTPRYLFPLFPLLYLYLVNGLDWIASWLAGRFAQPIIVPVSLACLVVPLLVIFGLRDINDVINPISDNITDLTVGTTWIAANADPNAVIMCRDPMSRYIYARRLTTNFPETVDELSLMEEIESQQVSYVLVGPKVQLSPTPRLDEYQVKYVLPFLQQHPDRFQLVYKNDVEQVSVYQVVHED